jgi:hypothetical protein
MTRLRYNKNRDGLLESNLMLLDDKIVYALIDTIGRFGVIQTKHEEVIEKFENNNVDIMKKQIKDKLKFLGVSFYDEVRGRK